MAGLLIPSGAARPSASEKRFVYTVRPRPQTARSEQPQQEAEGVTEEAPGDMAEIAEDGEESE